MYKCCFKVYISNRCSSCCTVEMVGFGGKTWFTDQTELTWEVGRYYPHQLTSLKPDSPELLLKVIRFNVFKTNLTNISFKTTFTPVAVKSCWSTSWDTQCITMYYTIHIVSLYSTITEVDYRKAILIHTKSMLAETEARCRNRSYAEPVTLLKAFPKHKSPILDLYTSNNIQPLLNKSDWIGTGTWMPGAANWASP